VRRAVAGAAVAVVAAIGSPLAAAGVIPKAAIVLEASTGGPFRDAASAPPRFVLLEDGQVFVGGTERLEAGRLEKGEAQALKKRAEAVRKLPGLGERVVLGGDPAVTMRLRLLDDKPFEVVVAGDPAQAPPHLAPLATLLADLLRFDHPTLRPYAPPGYAMVVREGRLVGGCRPWGFTFPIAAALSGPRLVSPAEAVGWPTGAVPASVCAADTDPSDPAGKRYVVTLRPLLPGEQP
jgi:hypothetical protein